MTTTAEELEATVRFVPVLGEARHRCPCSPCRKDLYLSRSTPSEEKQVGHSEGIMRPLMLALGATPFVGVPAPIALVRCSYWPECSRKS